MMSLFFDDNDTNMCDWELYDVAAISGKQNRKQKRGPGPRRRCGGGGGGNKKSDKQSHTTNTSLKVKRKRRKFRKDGGRFQKKPQLRFFYGDNFALPTVNHHDEFLKKHRR